MQTALRLAAIAAALFSFAPFTEAQTARPVDPPAVKTDEYLPNEYLEPTLLAIQVRRSEDRILALEQTNEKLVKGYNDLAQKYNELVEYLKQIQR